MGASQNLPPALQSLFARNIAFRQAQSLEHEGEESPTKRGRMSESPGVLREAAAEGLVGVEPVSLAGGEEGEEGISALEKSGTSGIGMGMGEEDELGIPDMPEEIDADFGMPQEDYETPLDGGASLLADETQLMLEGEEAGEESPSAELERDRKTGWSVRTHESLARLRKSIGGTARGRKGASIAFPAVVEAVEQPEIPIRRKAAQQFFEMLVLQSRAVIELEQESPMGELLIRQGEKFQTV